MTSCSVVIPTCGRAQLLERCLASLVEAGTASEIIVADDAASLAVADLASAFGSAVRYVAVNPPHRGPAAARNIGWRAATGEVIAFTDDDTIPDPCWIPHGVSAMAGAAAAWGDVVVPLPADPTDYERDAARLTGAVFVTANCFVRRDVLQALDGFDERFKKAWREDSDLYFRLLDAGYAVVHAADAQVIHPVRPAAWYVSLKQQAKTMYDALLYKKHPHRYREFIRPRLPRVFYATVLALGGTLAGSATAAIFWAALTARFCAERLAGTSRSPRHIAEVALTSMIIPPLSVFWRLRGALEFRVLYW